MRWTKVLNVVECDVGGEVAKVMTGGVVAAIALVIARAATSSADTPAPVTE